MCENCKAPKVTCESCEYNAGFDDWQGRKPCGQFNCWYGCTVCQYNGGLYEGEENQEGRE